MENMDEILLDNYQNVKSPAKTMCDNLEFWMTRLPALLRNLPIIHLAIPGKFKFCKNSQISQFS